MIIPEYPESREIYLEDKPLFDSIFADKQPEVSAYTFTNLFAWRDSYKTRVSQIGDCIVVHHNSGDKRRCLTPLGGEPRAAIEAVLDISGDNAEFERICKEVASLFDDAPEFVVELDCDNSDYLYLSECLIELTGRHLDAKRNHINRFRSKYNYTYEVMDQKSARECHEYSDQWCEDRSCHTVEGMHKEICAVYQMLENYDALGICGGLIRLDGNIVAFALGEELNSETLVVHVEKANADLDGLYQVINNEFCIHEAARYKYVNREQDLGVPGLRKAKKSYHPVAMIDTYKIRKATGTN